MATIQKSAMLAIVFALPAMAPSSAPAQPTKVRTFQVTELWSEDLQTRASAFMGLCDQQRQMIKALTAKVAEEKTAREDFLAPPSLAAQVLGSFGSMGAGLRTSIPTLVRHVEYRAPMLIDEISWLNGYPCALALRDIGHTSVAYILTHLQVADPEMVSDKAMELYGYTMIEIYGPDTLDECIAWVEVRAKRSVRSRGAHNFERLLSHLDEYGNKIRPRK